MPVIWNGATRKVIVSREEVHRFNYQWPGTPMRSTRHYWFEFDESRDLVDHDVPYGEYGETAKAMARDCEAWLFDEVEPEWSVTAP